MMRNELKTIIKKEYFDWIYSIGNNSSAISYHELFTFLHEIKFISVLKDDRNRAMDGENLRWRFAYLTGRDKVFDDISECLKGRCSVLEMMTALAIRCEEEIMDDPRKGNRTNQGLWLMLNNMGLGGMYDGHFDEDEVKKKVTIMMERSYSPDGRGGLFRIYNCPADLRDVDIWTQLCWFLDSIS